MDISETFIYDENSPSCLKWARDSYSGNGKLQVSKGDYAGSLNKSGQYEVWYQGRLQQCHRLVYELHKGPIAEGMLIDHIDGNRSNNLISNLRTVDYKINSRNRKKSIANKTGVTGVYQCFDKQKNLVGYIASWQLTEGYKSDSKRFTFKEYGEDALNAAAYWRDMMIDFLNADGAGYTEDHGIRS